MIMESYSRAEARRGEVEIVWVVPREEAIKLPYVRESLTGGMRRKPSRPRAPGLIAYAIKRRFKDARGGRRLWYLKEHDPYPGRGGPTEAVDPRSIAAGEMSMEMTEEQWERQGEFAARDKSHNG